MNKITPDFKVARSSKTVEKIALVVLGMHRSGTSALARCLNIIGAEMPNNVMPSTPFNKKGHWEPERLVALHDEIFAKMRSRWDDWRQFDFTALSQEDQIHYKSALRGMIAEEYRDASTIVLKDPRISKLVPLYDNLLPSLKFSPKYIISIRNPLEVAGSLKRRDNIITAYSSLVWLRYILDAEYFTRRKARVFTSYDRLLDDPSRALSHVLHVLKLRERLEITPDHNAKISEFLSPKLRSQEVSQDELDADENLGDWVKQAYGAILTLSNPPSESAQNAAEALLDKIRMDFSQFVKTVGDATYREFSRREESYYHDFYKLNQKNSELETSLAVQNSKLENVHKLISDEKIRAEKLVAEKLELQSSLAIQQSKLDDVQQAISDEKNISEKLVTEKFELKSSLAIQQAKLEGVQQSISDEKKLNGKLTTEKSELQSVLTLLQSNLEDAQTSISDEKIRVEKLGGDITILRRSLEDMIARNDILERSNSKLETYVSKLGHEHEQLLSAHEAQKAEFRETLRAVKAQAEQEMKAQQEHSNLVLKSMQDHSEAVEFQAGQELTRHIAVVNDYTSSVSWRLTKPLRALKTGLSSKKSLKALLRSVLRSSFYLIPLKTKQRRKILHKYHSARLRNDIKRPVSSADVPAQNMENEVQHRDHERHNSDPQQDSHNGRLVLPPDGRWNIENYKNREADVTKFLAALSDPNGQEGVDPRNLDIQPLLSGPKVSIIVRTYKGRSKLLEIALKSIIAQTYNSIEVLVIEDGGAEHAELVETLGKHASNCNFRHIAIEKLGRSVAANTGFDAATGDYIGLLDDDDYFYPDHISRLVGLLTARPELDAAYAAAIELGGDIDPVTKTYEVKQENAVFLKPMGLSAELLNQNYFPIQTVLFKRILRKPHDVFNPRLDALEDWLFWIRLLVGKKVGATSKITSAFYVPIDAAKNKQRINSHIKAEPFFSTQRTTFFEERRLSDMEPINVMAHDLKNKALDRAMLPVSKNVETLERPKNMALAHVLDAPLKPDIAPKFPRKVVAYTSINLRYLPKALTWAKSVKALNPDWETHILLNDDIPKNAKNWPNVDVVYPISKLDVPNFEQWAFTMRVVEMCTATKPFYAKKLLDAGFDHVFYFDPDTHAYSDLNQLIDEFGEDEVLITPHCCEDAMADSEIHFNEMSALAHGVYNLGFLGLKQGENAHAVVDFWCRRLLRHCADDHGRGLFTDQKWFNLVPVFFDKVKTLKHKGCNTASWNVAKRPLTREGNTILAGGQPLIFFHFSGYDKNVPQAMFDIFDKFSRPLEKMIEAYDDANDKFARQFKEWKTEWALARYSDGGEILDAHRELYRTRYQFQLIYETPYSVREDSYKTMLENWGHQYVHEQVSPPGYIKRYF